MRRLPPLSSLRAFEAAARHASFKRAAQELGVTPTAISHRIRQLEEHMGASLFTRRTRQVALTPAGETLYPVLRDGFDAFERATSAISVSRARVTISATPAFTATWLVPRAARFHALHPAIDLQFHASNDVVDLDAGAADLAIRYGEGRYGDLASEPLFPDRFAPLASPALGISSLDDLQRVTLIHFDWKRAHSANPTWARWMRSAGVAFKTAAPAMSFSDEGHAIQAVIAGQGVGLLSLALTAGELASGSLIQPFAHTVEGMTYHLVQSRARPQTPGKAAVREWLLSEARAWSMDTLGTPA